MSAPKPSEAGHNADYVADAFDEGDEAIRLGGLLLAVLAAHGCGCVHCAKAWDTLDEYPEFADSLRGAPSPLQIDGGVEP